MQDELKVGDIIIVDSFGSQGVSVGRHSFVVIDDTNNEVCGLYYDFIALLMSTFKDEEQRKKKMKFPGNFPVAASSEDIERGHGREGYIKAEQFYYFSKAKTPYLIIGELKAETLESLFDFIESMPEKGIKIQRIIDNL